VGVFHVLPNRYRHARCKLLILWIFCPDWGITDALNMTGMFGQGTIEKEPEIT
jgi:hypothetical protein